eukprot:SM000002S05571  [mRNA]  locus=s2:949956:953000:- [translate_table: standard]
MAMQAGFAGSRVLLLLGAGLGGSLLLNNVHLRDLLADLSRVLSKHLREKEEAGESAFDSTTAALTAQVRRLTAELRQLASSSSRPITVVTNQGRSVSVASYMVPAAVVGLAGYGYVRWKGWSVGDFMYVTKQGMNSAVASVTKQLETVSAALAAAKRQISRRLDGVTKSLEDQSEATRALKGEVENVGTRIGLLGEDVETVQNMVQGLEVKIDTIESKQDFANQGIVLLCRFVMQSLEGVQKPELVQNMHQYAKIPFSRSTSFPASLGLKDLEMISNTLSNPTQNGSARPPLLPSHPCRTQSGKV